MMKRVFATLLALTMAFLLLPKTARAATAVSVAGTPLTNPGYYEVNAAGGMQSSDAANYSVWWEGADRLHIRSLQFRYTTDSDTPIYGIVVQGDITLILEGPTPSDITVVNRGGDVQSKAYGVCVDGNLTVNGPGSLTAKAEGSSANEGVYALGDISVASGSLTGEATGGNSKGVAADGAINVSGTGKLVGKSFNGAPPVGVSYYINGHGIKADSDVTVSDSGILEGHASNDTFTSTTRGSYGIWPKMANIIVNGGTLLATTTNGSALLLTGGSTLVLGNGVAAAGSVHTSGANPETYAAARNDSYLWVKAPATGGGGSDGLLGGLGADVPKTGDDAPLALLSALMLLCGAALLARRRCRGSDGRR